jgi:hypothetical protein
MVGLCEHGNKLPSPLKAGNFLTSWVTISFSRNNLQLSVNILEAMKEDEKIFWTGSAFPKQMYLDTYMTLIRKIDQSINNCELDTWVSDSGSNISTMYYSGGGVLLLTKIKLHFAYSQIKNANGMHFVPSRNLL